MDLRFTAADALYSLLAFASLLIISAAVTAIQILPLLWKKDAPWYEQARILWPARSVLVMVQMIGAVSFCFYPQTPFSLVRLVWFAAAFLGALVCAYLFHPLFLRRRYSPASWFRHWLTVTVIFALPAVVAITLCCAGTSQWTSVTTVQLVMLILFYIVWLHVGPLFLLRLFKLAAPVPENISAIIAEESARMNHPVPKAAVVHWHVPNAAALPIPQQLLFSSALVADFENEEIRTIVRHELGHLTESKVVQLARGAAFLIFVPIAFAVPAVSTFGIHIVVLAYLIGFVIYLLTLKLSRRMEIRADAIASQDSNSETLYTQALLRLYSRALIPAVLGKRHTTHPDLYDRLVNCGLTPDFPRPKRPPRLIPLFLMIVGVIGIVLAAHISTRICDRVGGLERSYPQNNGFVSVP